MIDTLHIYLTSRHAYVRRQSGWPWKAGIEALPPFEWDARSPASLDFSTLPVPSARWRRRQVRVYLGSSLCRLMALEIPSAVSGMAEAEVVAMATMEHELGIPAAEWRCALDRAPSGAKSTACAIRRDLFERLDAIAAEYKWRLSSVRPLAGALWNAVQDMPAWRADAPRALLVAEDDGFASILGAGGQLLSVLALPHGIDDAVIERELRRLAYAAPPGATVDARLAAAASRRGMAAAHLSLMLPCAVDGDGVSPCFPDFRDMFLTIPGVPA
ncbi:hypothetical protein LPN04_10765 [Rugamonas sp. A1-17]|nr:hypothetical protein [Rugamonas sp. A1-17]